MPPTAAATTRTPPVRFTGFLALALVLHGLLLLLPAKRGAPPGEVLNRLSVSLQSITAQRPVAAAPADQEEPSPAAAPAAPPPAPTLPATESIAPSNPAIMPAVPPASPVPSTARLLDHAYRMRWRLPDDGGVRRLGESVPSSGNELPLPGSSGRPARAAPARSVEIVDRWLAADGSHNVVLRAPSGDLLCGRAEAWDPLRPLVEHVTMFGACGNGEPTFEWPDRYGTAAPPPLATAVVQ